MLNKLIDQIENVGLKNYPRHSRTHRLNGFGENYFVKRDDELSFGISGSKMRKYLSLIPSLKDFKEVVLIGGASSNNIVGLSQLLIEEGIQPVLFLCGHKPENPTGNLLISHLLVDQKHIHWHDKKSWPHITQLAEEYAKNRGGCCVIPEGASSPAALPGALTLALDIIENERNLNNSFDHILCDAGTGMTASALVLCNSLLRRKAHHHILLLAEDEQSFLTTFSKWKDAFESLVGEKIDELAPMKLYKPTQAPSFGSINTGIKKEILRLAREEGILSDPVYSAKLFAEARNIKLDGNTLLIHSGGALPLISTPNLLV